MLQISQPQLDALDSEARSRSRSHLAAWLQEQGGPTRSIDHSEILALIDRQIPRAATFDFSTERQLAKWCYLALLTNERFDQLPEVQAILRDQRLGSLDLRLELLLIGLARAAELDEAARIV